MSQLAQQLIAENKRTQAKSLDLGNCGLTDLNDIPELFDCVWLEELNLGDYYWDSEKGKRVQSPNSIALNKINKISLITQLTNIEKIHLDDNDISEGDFLGNFKKLKTLTLTHSKISDIHFLENLSTLETLDLSGNQICDYSFLEKLTGLKALYLCANQINNIYFLKKLKGLHTLDLRFNEISDISPLEKLVNLHFLYLNGNFIHDITPLITFIRKRIYLNCHDNPITTPPLEIVRQGNQAILNYFAELEEGEETVYEAKLLIIGQAGVGKTTLKRRIDDCNAPMPNETDDTTVGIDISQHIFEATEDLPEFKMNVWDFGGQEVYHSTHQFFLSKRSLYVLVDDGRTEDHNRYWLQVQELFGDDSPLLILVNRKGNIHRQIALNELKGNFPNLRELHSINLQTDTDEINRYRTILEAQIRHLPQYQKGEKLPKRWVDIRRALEEIDENYISLKGFRQLCSEHGMTELKSQDFLSDYLHDLGVMLHFRDLKHPSLQKIVILRPEWATNAVYAILNHTKEKQSNGEFTYADLNQVWNSSDYQDLFGELLALMQKFELCYRLPQDESRFIVPQLLAPDQPDFDWDKEQNLQVRYEYDFMPKGIMTRFIVRLHRFIESPKLVWQRGVILEQGNTHALVVEEYRDEAITIRVKGSNPQALIPLILKEIDDINQSFHFNERMKVRKLVPCICTVCKGSSKPKLYDHDELIEVLNKGKHQFYCNTGFEFFNVRAALYNIGSKDGKIREDVRFEQENRVISKLSEIEHKREVEKQQQEVEKKRKEKVEKEKQATNSMLPYIALTVLVLAIAAFALLPDLRTHITIGFSFVIATIGVLNLFKK